MLFPYICSYRCIAKTTDPGTWYIVLRIMRAVLGATHREVWNFAVNRLCWTEVVCKQFAKGAPAVAIAAAGSLLHRLR